MILDNFEYRKFEVIKRDDTIAHLNGHVNGAFALYYEQDHKVWTIFHLPSGMGLSNLPIPTIELAAELCLELMKVRNDWNINICNLSKRDQDKIMVVMNVFMEKHMDDWENGELSDDTPSRRPLNGMRY